MEGEVERSLALIFQELPSSHRSFPVPASLYQKPPSPSLSSQLERFPGEHLCTRASQTEMLPGGSPQSAASNTPGPFLTHNLSCCPLKRITGFKACGNGFARGSPSALIKHCSPVKPILWSLIMSVSGRCTARPAYQAAVMTFVPLRKILAPKRRNSKKGGTY